MDERTPRAPGPAEDESTGQPQHARTDAPFTERIDRVTGTVRASGRLDSRSADMLSGTVEAMSRAGHGPVLLDLSAVTADDDAGLTAMRSLEERITAVGAHVGLRPPRPRSPESQGTAEPAGSTTAEAAPSAQLYT